MKRYLDKIFPQQTYTLSNGKEIQAPRNYALLVAVLFVLAFYASVKMTKFDLMVIIERGNQFFLYFANMFPMTEVGSTGIKLPLPELRYLSRIWGPLFDTIKMSILGSLIGSITAIPFAILASSNIVKSKIVLTIVRLFLGFVRTIPTLVVALIATYVLGLGTFAGTAAIAIFTFAYLGKLLYEQIETVEMGAYEAMQALGATKLQSFIAAISPQILPGYIANCLYCFEGNVRYSAILGYVGAGGLGLIINEKIGWREYPSVGMILIALLVTVAIIEMFSHYLRTKLT